MDFNFDKDTKAALVEILEHEMGIDPKTVAVDGANSDGYRQFVLDSQGVKILWGGGRVLEIFRPWTESQKNIIFEHSELFDKWFGTFTAPTVLNAQIVIDVLTTGNNTKAYFVGSENRFSGIHPMPGESIDIPVTLRVTNHS